MTFIKTKNGCYDENDECENYFEKATSITDTVSDVVSVIIANHRGYHRKENDLPSQAIYINLKTPDNKVLCISYSKKEYGDISVRYKDPKFSDADVVKIFKDIEQCIKTNKDIDDTYIIDLIKSIIK